MKERLEITNALLYSMSLRLYGKENFTELLLVIDKTIEQNEKVLFEANNKQSETK